MRVKIWIQCGLLLTCLLSCSGEKERVPADFYLVIDTSGSMASGTMKQVKQKLPILLDSMHAGDRIHLIQFDEKAQLIGDFTLQGDPDRIAIEKAIDELKPSGPYTDMKALISHLKSSLQSQNQKSSPYIIVLSDGIDDPRPGSGAREERVRLSEYEAQEKLPVQEPYIYYIHLGKSDVTGKEEGLKEDLKELSADVKVVQPKKTADGNDAGLAEVKKDIESTRPGQEIFWQKLVRWAGTVPLWAWGVAGALLLLLLLFLYRTFGRTIKPLAGKLSFYESSEHPSMAREVNLHKFRRSDITIGSGSGAIIRIKDGAFPDLIRMKAKRSGKELFFSLAKKDLQRMEFLVQKKRALISSGDRFRITNYTFEYTHVTKK